MWPKLAFVPLGDEALGDEGSRPWSKTGSRVPVYRLLKCSRHEMRGEKCADGVGIRATMGRGQGAKKREMSRRVSEVSG